MSGGNHPHGDCEDCARLRAEVERIAKLEAVVDAAVTDSGGELVFARGVVLATHAGPTLDDVVWFSGGGSGTRKPAADSAWVSSISFCGTASTCRIR